jgi:hypothetical protein
MNGLIEKASPGRDVRWTTSECWPTGAIFLDVDQEVVSFEAELVERLAGAR